MGLTHYRSTAMPFLADAGSKGKSPEPFMNPRRTMSESRDPSGKLGSRVGPRRGARGADHRTQGLKADFHEGVEKREPSCTVGGNVN